MVVGGKDTRMKAAAFYLFYFSLDMFCAQETPNKIHELSNGNPTKHSKLNFSDKTQKGEQGKLQPLNNSKAAATNRELKKTGAIVTEIRILPHSKETLNHCKKLKCNLCYPNIQQSYPASVDCKSYKQTVPKYQT